MRIHGKTLTSAIIAFACLTAAAQVTVPTYHYDNKRTGWNSHETSLTPANVTTKSFGLLHTVALDDQVDGQPLVVPGVPITAGPFSGTTHDVVYVATQGNTVYAIDVHTGAILLSPNFGTPGSWPLGCNNNGPRVGITSTPVIDRAAAILYVMVYTQTGSVRDYTLHALDLGSLTDKVTPQPVAASHTLSSGATFNFKANYQRQRPALLLHEGNVYAGFGSFCDFSANVSRGWLLGWNAPTLTPLPSNQLNDLQPRQSSGFFLSSIWMSGFGPATNEEGDILFVTGNSNPGSYDGVSNIQESVVKVSATLANVLDLFTPKDQVFLDQEDNDFGSGGVLVLPDQPGATPHLAVAAGKDGNLYLMDEDNLGGFSPHRNNVLGTYPIGGCWCGPSYYTAADGTGRIVASGGNNVSLYQVETAPKAALKFLKGSNSIPGSQNPGFFTVVSSNGPANQIIWALSHPTGSGDNPIYLYAFDPNSGNSTMNTIFSAKAGFWPNFTGNSNLVPVVANGQVFVASHKTLTIFGLRQ
ncbi:MAG TPA: hypothetical protein VF753_16655 [Terriglobales bacterium]